VDITFFLVYIVLASKIYPGIMFYRWRVLSTKQTWWNWRTLWWLCLARILWLILRNLRYKEEIWIIFYGRVLTSHQWPLTYSSKADWFLQSDNVDRIITSEYMKVDISELRKMMWRYDWSSQLCQAVVKLKPEKKKNSGLNGIWSNIPSGRIIIDHVLLFIF